jgi:hypothetical protein
MFRINVVSFVLAGVFVLALTPAAFAQSGQRLDPAAGPGTSCAQSDLRSDANGPFGLDTGSILTRTFGGSCPENSYPTAPGRGAGAR